MIIIIIKKLVASLVRETVAIIKLPVLYINLLFVFDFVVKPIRGDTFLIYLLTCLQDQAFFWHVKSVMISLQGFQFIYSWTPGLSSNIHTQGCCVLELFQRGGDSRALKVIGVFVLGGGRNYVTMISHPRSKGLCSSSASSHEAGRRYPRRQVLFLPTLSLLLWSY